MQDQHQTGKATGGAAWMLTLLLGGLLLSSIVMANLSPTQAAGRMPTFRAVAQLSVGASGTGAHSGAKAAHVPGVPLNDAYLELRPGTGAPPNGGTAQVGDRFVLELWLNPGTHTDLVGQQSYLTFTHQLIQNARVSTIGTSCTLTSTVTGDFVVFDTQLQNQVCNGPNPCTFSGNSVPPGSIAFASGALNNPPAGGEGPFRVAQIGICAVGEGGAQLHWQFSPPDPSNRNTKITDEFGAQVENRALFVDYTFMVLGNATQTPTVTRTAVATSTSSATATPSNTATYTPTQTATALNTSTVTPTPSSTATVIPTSTGTTTPSSTATATGTSTATRTTTATITPTSTATNTSTNTPTRTPTSTNTATNTPTNTATHTATNTTVPTATRTNTTTPTATSIPTSSQTNTVVPTYTRTNTAVPTATGTSTPTATPVPPTATGTNTPLPPTGTHTPSATATAAPPTATRTNTVVPTSTQTNVPSTATRTSTVTNTPVAATATLTVTVVPTATQTQTRTAMPTTPATNTALPTGTSTGTATGTSVPPSTSTPSSTSVPPTGTRTATSTVLPTGTATQTAAMPTATQSGTAVSTATNTATNTALPAATATLCPIQFSDVPPEHTFYANIRCLACRAILGGYVDGTFRPGADITRGQIAKIVSNAAGFVEPVTGQTYQDVSPSNTFYLWIERLSARGHIGGYPCGGPLEPCIVPDNKPYFRPFANATRGQIAKIVSNSANFVEPVTGLFYTDVPASNSFYTWIMRLANRGVMSGYPCGGINPYTGQSEPCDSQNRPYFRWGNQVTRGQASKIVSNTFFPECAIP